MTKINILIYSLIILLIFSLNSFAAYEDSDTGLYKFECTMVAFSISYDNAQTWHNIFDYTDVYEADPTDSRIPKVDVAESDNPGQQLGTFIEGASIPPGTITHIKPKFPNGSEVMKGWHKDTDDTIYYTSSSGTSEWIPADHGGQETPNESDCSDMTITSDPSEGDYLEELDEIVGSAEVLPGGEFNLSVQFDLSTSLDVYDEEGGKEIGPSEDFFPTITQI